jgi:capsular polysaccharide biosynthesis protein
MWVLVLGVVYTFTIAKPQYTANTSLIIQVDAETTTGGSELSALQIANYLITTYGDFIISNTVLESVKTEIENEYGIVLSIQQIKNSISVTTATQNMFIYIETEADSPEIAQALANTLAENSIEIANSTYVDGEEEKPVYRFLYNNLMIHDEALLPVSPSSPNKVLNVVISGLLGGIIALGVVFIKEFFNNKYKSVEDLERHLNLKVIAAVPGTIKERKLVD